MKRSLISILILTFLCVYTFFKTLQFFPNQIAISMIIAFGIFFAMIAGIRFTKSGSILSTLLSIITGFWSVFIFLSIPFDLGLFIYSFFTPTSVFHLSQQVEVFVFGLSATLSFLGLIQALRGPAIKKVECKIAGLPKDLEDFRIVQLSDLHIGPTIKRKYIERVVKLSNSLSADAIVITGDLADGNPKTLHDDIQPLADLHSKYGVFYITGNHEYYWGASAWIKAMADLGLTPLINENRIISINQTDLMIAGITDTIGGKFVPGHEPDMTRALHRDTKTSLKILLSHRPDPYKEAEEKGVDLQFSGHTHGGQYFPFNLMISFFHTYYSHLNRYKNLWLYVNTGTGYWGPMNRLGVRAEITLCVLKASDAIL